MPFTDPAPAALQDILAAAWAMLERGARDPADDLHWPVLASVDTRDPGSPVPDARTVVLREVDRATRLLHVHSDLRAHKVAQLRAQPQVCLVLHHRNADVQLRLRACASLHAGDGPARRAWDALPASSRRAYLAPAPPGTESLHDDPNLPPEFRGRLPDALQSQSGFVNFALIALRVHGIDWLRLGRTGHQRARFDWPQSAPVAEAGARGADAIERAPAACWLHP